MYWPVAYFLSERGEGSKPVSVDLVTFLEKGKEDSRSRTVVTVVVCSKPLKSHSAVGGWNTLNTLIHFEGS